MSALSVVVPVLNEADSIAQTLQCLQRMRGRRCEVVVVDGGSTDGTVTVAEPLCDRVLTVAPGRARQMNAGAAEAGGDVLWFLHADTRVPPEADREIVAALMTGSRWGRFDVRLSGPHPLLRVVETMMNLRSRWSGIATGDQGMFMSREAWLAVGGFPDIPLMEDIAISKRLLRLGPPACLRARLITSSRRWDQRGIVATVMLMWRVRFGYWFGVPPAKLARIYHGD
jgi:rSAM/selenodomain-associated transferase 2